MPLPLWPTPDELKRMAFQPSRYAPTAAEVLTPGQMPSPQIEFGPEERRLMDAILIAPDADEPRLRFAEFIESSDPSRAAFIRAQMISESDRSDRPPTRPSGDLPLKGGGGRMGLVSSTSPLEVEVGERSEPGGGYRNPLTISPDPRWALPFHIFGARDFVYKRGFIEGMSLTARSFLAHSDAIFAATPLRVVRFVAYEFFLDELLACENLKRLDPGVRMALLAEFNLFCRSG